ncbi:polysaccharide transporter, PST family [Amphibacillus marinus]|uniref:Polysaccharide transporter, PST family n=1 Tax=Amphibacillus marinus TaxID=872970 RepID=A0A1H8TMG5_9BACI|nr:polysaccharide biosynthesis protein [Amphibacillus marinus]SEO92047.1 polysaccharide transporter, PST family [Amphibacillus marinus]
MKKRLEQRQFYRGAFLLTYAGLLSKLLSAMYRVPLQNITGDVGFYVYQQVYPFIGIATMLALYGFPAAISSLVVQHSGQLDKRLTRRVFWHLLLFSGLLFCLIFIFAPTIAREMGDVNLTMAIRACSCLFLPIPFVATLRGVFQGQSNMTPTAVSQIIEQIVRVSLIIALALVIVRLDGLVYHVGIGAVLASFVGAVAAAIFLYIYSFKKQPPRERVSNMSCSALYIWKTIIGFGLVMAVNHMLLLLLQLVDALTFVPHLLETGIPLSEAQVLKGVLDRGQPLAQLGIVLASSLTLALIPSVTKARLLSNQEQFRAYITSTWRFTLYLSAGATAGLIVLLPEINLVLFKEDVGTVSLQIFTFTILFASLSISTAAILQGLEYVYRTAIFVLIGVLAKFIFNIILVPYLSIVGAATATVLATIIVLVLNMTQLKRAVPNQKIMQVPWLRFGSALLIMVGAVTLINRVGQSLFISGSRLGQLFYIIIVVLFGIIIYFFSLVMLSVFTKQERDVLPFKRFLND